MKLPGNTLCQVFFVLAETNFGWDSTAEYERRLREGVNCCLQLMRRSSGIVHSASETGTSTRNSFKDVSSP